MSERRHEVETWSQKNWRGYMAWQYTAVCLFDFMLAPIFTWWYSYITKSPLIPWVPLTIQGGSMYHLAMGAVVGITSYAKTQEKINSAGFQSLPSVDSSAPDVITTTTTQTK